MTAVPLMPDQPVTQKGDRPSRELVEIIQRLVRQVSAGGAVAWGDITGVPATFPPDAHAHPQSDVTGLVAALAGKSDTSHTHLLAAGATDVTMTATNLNTLDDGADTALHFHAADRARAVHTGTQLSATISDLAATVQAYTLDLFANPAASLDFAQQQTLQFVIENRTSDPGSPVSGQLWLRTDI